MPYAQYQTSKISDMERNFATSWPHGHPRTTHGQTGSINFRITSGTNLLALAVPDKIFDGSFHERLGTGGQLAHN